MFEYILKFLLSIRQIGRPVDFICLLSDFKKTLVDPNRINTQEKQELSASALI